MNCGDCDPQKAHLLVIPSRLSIYTSKSVHGFGLAAFPRKKKKKSHTRSIFRQNSPSHGGATGYSIGTKFGRMVAPLDLITLANFKLGRLRTGCVALHESLLSFRFSALHRLSPLTQLGPAGPLVIAIHAALRNSRRDECCISPTNFPSCQGQAGTNNRCGSHIRRRPAGSRDLLPRTVLHPAVHSSDHPLLKLPAV